MTSDSEAAKEYPPGMMPEENSEFFEVTYQEQVYQCRRLTGFKLLNAMSSVKKGMEFALRDLTAACLVDPKFTKAEIEQATPSWFMNIGVKIIKAHGITLEDFQDSLNGLNQ